MTGSTRVASRILLVVSGVVLLAAAALVLALSGAVPAFSDDPGVSGMLDVVTDGFAALEASPLVAFVTAGVALALTLWLIGFATSRGRGRTDVALVIGEGEDRVTITATAIGDILTHALGASTAVESLDASAYRVSRGRLRRSGFDAPRGGGSALLVTATVRSGASPVTARRDVARAVAALDAALERELPVVTHLRATRHRVTRAK